MKIKVLWQTALLIFEIAVVTGTATWVSLQYYQAEAGYEVVERAILFYGCYQLVVYVILSNLNGIKADEYLALKSCSQAALRAIASDSKDKKEMIFKNIDAQQRPEVMNDSKVKDIYRRLAKAVEEDDEEAAGDCLLLAEHGLEECQLQWKYSFILRAIK